MSDSNQFKPPTKILVVCSANRCRSVMTAEVLRWQLSRLPGFEDLNIDTCGVNQTIPFGVGADQQAITTLQNAKYMTPKDHTSKIITANLVEWADLIYVLDNTIRYSKLTDLVTLE